MPGEMECIEVLLVEDHVADARMVQWALGHCQGAMEISGGLFMVTHAARLEAAIAQLVQKPFDVVLLDLDLPDSEGIQTLLQIASAAATAPIVVLTGLDDDGLALQAIRRGAQDYLDKNRLDGRVLVRTIRQAIQRKRAELDSLRHTREVEVAREQIQRQATELQVRAEQLHRMNRDLDDFTYLASHDLKEPLRGIRGYCEILLEDCAEKLDLDGRRLLLTMEHMCDRLGKMIDNLLTYCRVGRVASPQVGCELGEVAEEVIGQLRPTIDRRGGYVRICGPLPRVAGEATLLGMVLGNLISNGLKFNDSLRPQVEIGALGDDPPTIYVRDNGIGIAAEHHEAIFTLFRRLHAHSKYEGTGAGLTIVRKILESHGGRIWLESAPGEGTTFFFTLAPAAEPVPPKPSTKAPHWVLPPAAPAGIAVRGEFEPQRTPLLH